MALLESQTYQKAYQKLVKKKTSYNSINQDLHDFFNDHKFDEICLKGREPYRKSIINSIPISEITIRIYK